MTYELAYKSFIEIGLILYPHCEIIEVAGSVRRALVSPDLQKREVKDVEIVALPKTEPSGLFDDAQVRSKDFCNAVRGNFIVTMGDVATGRYVKIAYSQGIKIDLFMPVKEDFYRQYAIRTGSADFAKNVLAVGWRKLGWVGTKDGLRRETECVASPAGEKQVWTCKAINPTLPPVWNSEKDFFEWLKIEYVEPEHRG